MAEREGFEPPIPLRVCLISSQVHSTGLCHLSAVFTTCYQIFDARSKITDWRKEYNEVRPHSSLDYRTPNEFAQVVKKASYGKDAGYACLENASGVSHFATAPATG